MATWHTPTTLRKVWKNAPSDDATCTQLLTAARAQIIAFAPVLPNVDVPPDTYVIAQGMQARAIWESQKANTASPDDAIGLEGFQVRVGTMTKAIRDLLRPPVPPIGIG